MNGIHDMGGMDGFGRVDTSADKDGVVFPGQWEGGVMAPRMERTRYPGIYKRGSRFVVVWEHRGRQHKSFHRTLSEAREAKGARSQPGERKPATRERLEDYARRWLDTYSGRTARGFADTSRRDYRRAIEQYAIPFFRRFRLADVEPPDVREFVAYLELANQLGRDLHFPVALEGALKLKEISYIHAEGYPTAEMKHGPIALVDPETPSVFVAPRGPLHAKTLSNVEEVRARVPIGRDQDLPRCVLPK